MFYNPRTWFTMRGRQLSGEHRNSPRFELPIFVRQASGDFEKSYGSCGIGGCDFTSSGVRQIGQQLAVRLALIGTGKQVDLTGTIVRLDSCAEGMKVAMKFDEIPAETESAISEWLERLSQAYGCLHRIAG